jgi:hypothetical protein
MKKIISGFLLLAALLIFGFTADIIGSAEASPLFAQVSQPSATPQPSTTPAPPKPTAPSADQPAPQPSKAPVVSTTKPPKEKSSGPYDMEAMKAFNRALYGS